MQSGGRGDISDPFQLTRQFREYEGGVHSRNVREKSEMSANVLERGIFLDRLVHILLYYRNRIYLGMNMLKMQLMPTIQFNHAVLLRRSTLKKTMYA